MVQIEKIEKLKSDLKIKWTDGEESAFNYMWLSCLLYTSDAADE